MLYVYAGDEESILDTELVKTFNSKYRGTIPYGLGTLSSNNNEALWTFTVSETDYNVYAFSPSSSNGISAWQYNNALSYTTDFTCSVSLKLNSDLDTAELYLDSVDSGVQYFGLDETNLDALKNSTYVHVYAAISAQGDKDANYSNIYWSNLTYVGSFSGFKDSTSTNSED